eukprot:4144054-Pyramimonas_sp.AAC.1
MELRRHRALAVEALELALAAPRCALQRRRVDWHAVGLDDGLNDVGQLAETPRAHRQVGRPARRRRCAEE